MASPCHDLRPRLRARGHFLSLSGHAQLAINFENILEERTGLEQKILTFKLQASSSICGRLVGDHNKNHNTGHVSTCARKSRISPTSLSFPVFSPISLFVAVSQACCVGVLQWCKHASHVQIFRNDPLSIFDSKLYNPNTVTHSLPLPPITITVIPSMLLLCRSSGNQGPS